MSYLDPLYQPILPFTKILAHNNSQLPELPLVEWEANLSPYSPLQILAPPLSQGGTNCSIIGAFVLRASAGLRLN